MKPTKCPKCGQPIGGLGGRCPYCGSPQITDKE